MKGFTVYAPDYKQVFLSLNYAMQTASDIAWMEDTRASVVSNETGEIVCTFDHGLLFDLTDSIFYIV